MKNMEQFSAFLDFLRNHDGYSETQIAAIVGNQELWYPEYVFWLENREAMERGEFDDE